MPRYIDTEKIVYYEYYPLSQIAPKNEIDKIPTADVVPVVRCKNCKYFTKKDHADGRCSLLFLSMKKNDFCSYGKDKKQ